MRRMFWGPPMCLRPCRQVLAGVREHLSRLWKARWSTHSRGRYALGAGAYARSKVEAERVIADLNRPVVVARAFHHTGPGSLHSMSWRIGPRRFERVRRPSAGNVTVERDFLDVRDVVNGYATLARNGVARGLQPVLGHGAPARISRLHDRGSVGACRGGVDACGKGMWTGSAATRVAPGLSDGAQRGRLRTRCARWFSRADYSSRMSMTPSPSMSRPVRRTVPLSSRYSQKSIRPSPFESRSLRRRLPFS